ncbi:hypothetical protein BO82DRAFT_417309 [Aspergillus uvarum CBS 121591]|uniref:Uncharacterized protein n=1 Tax=Aspergillus uvarum CBS 121591 TaxID=1448315 RepID=A0A319CPF1_9EURO|nr:hypothetical protein BO82DRAFT_417309 [Aspergillus uvarum CBS 121591]PYH80623.1 hypothetical protein BO82DRAFT_417309 [Aspergillus uvarum CBS 121591]
MTAYTEQTKKAWNSGLRRMSAYPQIDLYIYITLDSANSPLYTTLRTFPHSRQLQQQQQQQQQPTQSRPSHTPPTISSPMPLAMCRASTHIRAQVDAWGYKSFDQRGAGGNGKICHQEGFREIAVEVWVCMRLALWRYNALSRLFAGEGLVRGRSTGRGIAYAASLGLSSREWLIWRE